MLNLNYQLLKLVKIVVIVYIIRTFILCFERPNRKPCLYIIEI